MIEKTTFVERNINLQMKFFCFVCLIIKKFHFSVIIIILKSHNFFWSKINIFLAKSKDFTILFVKNFITFSFLSSSVQSFNDIVVVVVVCSENFFLRNYNFKSHHWEIFPEKNLQEHGHDDDKTMDTTSMKTSIVVFYSIFFDIFFI